MVELSSDSKSVAYTPDMAEFTAEQKDRLKNLFNHIDTDNDGLIQAADLKAFASAELGREITDDRAQVNICFSSL